MGQIVRFNSNVFFVGKKKGKIIRVKDEEGRVTKKVRLTKGVPKGCSTPRRICIKCQTSVIRKNDLNYESKVCKGCTDGI